MKLQPSPSSQPDRRALSPLKHGLTGRIYLLSQAEQDAYNLHVSSLHSDLAPVGEMETQLVQALCDDRWRLNRAVTIETAIFADAAGKAAADPANSTGDPDMDAALTAGRTWVAEARNFNLLTLYESRIQRRFEKNMAELRRLQAERKAALDQAIREAAHLAQLAENEGRAFDPAEPFLSRNFVFSAAQIAAMIDRYRRLEAAKKLFTGPRKPLRAVA